MEPMFLSFAAAVASTGLPKSTLYVLLADGRITGRKVGRRTLLDAASLRAFIEAQPLVQVRVPSARRLKLGAA
ncbi:MAG: helix-turn-helix domain-containing protein [Candidatus Dormibacteria bacterium]